MKEKSLGEFEELVLLMVAALHDQAYGVSILASLEEKLNKKVNIFFGFGFGRLDHDRTRDHQGKVNRRRVKPVIHQSFDNVQGGDLVGLLQFVGKHTLMHAGAIIGQFKRIFQLLFDIVGI